MSFWYSWLIGVSRTLAGSVDEGTGTGVAVAVEVGVKVGEGVGDGASVPKGGCALGVSVGDAGVPKEGCALNVMASSTLARGEVTAVAGGGVAVPGDCANEVGG